VGLRVVPRAHLTTKAFKSRALSIAIVSCQSGVGVLTAPAVSAPFDPLAGALGSSLSSTIDSPSRLWRMDGPQLGDCFKEPRCGPWLHSLPARPCSPQRRTRSVQTVAVAAIRDHERAAGREHGGDALWLACTTAM